MIETNRTPFALLVAGVHLFVSIPVLAEDSNQLTTFQDNVPISSCDVVFQYSISKDDLSDFSNSDVGNVGRLIYSTYTYDRDITKDFEKFRNGQGGNPIVQLTPDVVGHVNGYIDKLGLYAPRLSLRINTARVECSKGEVPRLEADDDSTRKEHIQRGLSWLSDIDPEIQKKGLHLLVSNATNIELWSLPESQRKQIGDLAYADVLREIDSLNKRRQTASIGVTDINMFGAGILERIVDSRAADSYMQYVLLDNEFLGSGAAVKSLSLMIPRPIQILPQLEEMAETPTNKLSGPGIKLHNDILGAVLTIGRHESRPFFESLARSTDTGLANTALSLIDSLNRGTLRAQSKPVTPSTTSSVPTEWYMMVGGECREQDPRTVLATGSVMGVQMATRDVREHGVVVKTTITASDGSLVTYYRGLSRCEAASNTDRYK